VKNALIYGLNLGSNGSETYQSTEKNHTRA